MHTDGLMSLAQVQDLIPHSRSWFFRQERLGRFPKRLPKRSRGAAVLYVRAEVMDWIDAAAAQRHEPDAWKQSA
jgi:predicted DNA-binding transcriptional regulator AlpA